MRRGLVAAIIGFGFLTATQAGAQQQQQQQQGTPYATQPVYTAPPQGGGQGQGEYVAPVQGQGQTQQQPIYVQQQQQPVMAGPREITSYEDGDPIPPGYHPDTRVRRGLVIGGAVTFGVMYLISALVGAGSLAACSARTFVTNSPCNDVGPLLIPVAGPFIAIGTSHSDAVGTTALVIDGAVQVGGVLMLVLGIAIPRTVLVRNDIGSNKKLPFATIEPVIGGTQNGLKITF